MLTSHLPASCRTFSAPTSATVATLQVRSPRSYTTPHSKIARCYAGVHEREVPAELQDKGYDPPPPPPEEKKKRKKKKQKKKASDGGRFERGEGWV